MVAIVAIGVLSMYLLYRGVIGVRAALVRLAEVDEPRRSATHEMEINMNGLCLGALRYLHDPNESHRRLVEKDEQDFAFFHAQYSRLAVTPLEKELAERAGSLFREMQTTAHRLMRDRDQQRASLNTLYQVIEEIDGILDQELQAHIGVEEADGFGKLIWLNSLEADLAEVNMWLAHYMRSRQPKHAKLITVNEREFRENLAHRRSLRLTAAETQWVGEVEQRFGRMMSYLPEVLSLEASNHAGEEQLLRFRSAMDDILDEEIQILALEHVRRPPGEASAIASQVLRNARGLIAVFLLAALGVTIVSARAVARSLLPLRVGAEALGRGDSSHRIAVEGRDEFADLAEAFNRMATQLQDTTVSKTALEASDQRLQETVRHLRQEIAERERVQQQRAKLEASLRRAETWSALGALLAGVIHQVRNPLFGISSIVDAMETRFGDRDEYRQYVDHLRVQVTRVTALLQELLEYAKPTNQERAPTPLLEVLGEAVRACQPLAERVGAELELRLPAELGLLAADRACLVRAFECLVENALHHSPPGGVVRIEAELVGDELQPWVECRVTDDGPGFRAEDLPHVFEPFFSRRPGGTGLGLAIAHRIAVDHGGEVNAANGVDGGAQITVRLPLLAQQGEDAP